MVQYDAVLKKFLWNLLYKAKSVKVYFSREICYNFFMSDEVVEKLKELGLNSYEAKVYLALLKKYPSAVPVSAPSRRSWCMCRTHCFPTRRL